MTTEQKDEIVWSEEAQNLGENNSTEFFTPSEGENEISFLDNGEFVKKNFKSDTPAEDDPDAEDFARFHVEVDGEEMIWDVRKASTESSLYGQIARYAAASKGLEGETIQLFRQGTKMNTNYVLTSLQDVESQDSEDDVVFGEDDETVEESEDELFEGDEAKAKA